MRSWVALAIALSLAPFALAAEPAPARVGILIQEMGRAQSQSIKGLTEELKRLGYRERQNLFIETLNVKNNRAALETAARELLAKEVALIVTTGTSATRAAMAAAGDIPLVFVYPGNPITAGIIENAETRPQNITGVAAYAGETTDTRLALIEEIVPGLKEIVVFYDVNNDRFKQAESAARKLGLQSTGYGVKSVDELRTTLAGLRAESGTAIFQVSDELVESEAEFIFATARNKKIPTMFNEESWVVAGALAGYGPSYFAMGRRAGRLAGRILKGEKPQRLPIERATEFDLTLNYRTARFIGVNFSPAMLKKARRVIR